MPYRRSGQYYRRRTTNRRAKTWYRFAKGASGNDSINLFGGGFDPAQVERTGAAWRAYEPSATVPQGSTIARIRAHLSYQFPGATVTGMYLGVIVAPVVGGNLTLPSPWEEAEEVDWLHWEYIPSIPDGAVWNTEQSGTSYASKTIDIRSKRVVREVSQTCYAVVGNAGTTTNTAYNLIGSVLILKP